MADVTMAITFRDDTVIRATGFFNIENWESESQKLTLALYPRDNRWEVAVGSGVDMHGTPKQLTINGVTYRFRGDANLTFQPSAYKNEAEPTTGGNTRKMTLQVREITGCAITCNATEHQTLRALAES